MRIELRLIGEGISQSKTPRLHEAEGRAQGLDIDYRLVDVSALPFAGLSIAEILDKLEAEAVRGANVTYPFKGSVMAHLDEISEEALAVGAVNTVVFREGKRLGFNTDIYGFSQMMKRGLGAKPPERVLLIGAGGAGGAIVRALSDWGVAEIWVHDIDPLKAAEFVTRLQGAAARLRAVEMDAKDVAAVDGVINATPMGMAKYPGAPLDVGLLRADQFVADIVYFPLETALLQGARMRGCQVISGALMAVAQAAQAFEIFTGRCADEARMFESFEALRRGVSA